MKKKDYQKPHMEAVKLNIQATILSGSPVRYISSGGIFNEEVTGGSGTARSREFSAFDDEEDYEWNSTGW